ncbi:1-acyl-sn-glycerol-3-phosphate acyltransferase alpha-like [Diadema setosum]|uniref:1-acyl-sn-glycerol-3-phosphate acyltransferase alpha-like n=1 Tax=Diadema setosum TaxID=31175 RepID=UPI003B3B9F09
MELDWIQIFVISVLLSLILLYELSSTFKYYAKMILYYTLVSIYSVIVCILSLPRPRDPTNLRFASWLLSNTNSLFGIRAEVRGLHHLDYNKPCVVVANHQSSIDLFSMFSFGVWPKRCVPIGKKELLFTGTFGACLYLCGIIFIDRLNPDKARNTLERTAKYMEDNNVPIIPIVFSSYSEFYSKREKRFWTGKFTITVLPPIPTEGRRATR